MILKRCFDIVFSFFGLIILFPVLLIISLHIALDSKGPILFFQKRVGKNNKDFQIVKFRTMQMGSQEKGLLTLGDNDPRVTKVGVFLRKYKLDELPQLFNVFNGTMSFVGPRPELRNFVETYPDEYNEVLSIKPGITDLASIAFRDEAELLKHQQNPEQYYLNIILPKKLILHKEYIENKNFLMDIQIIFKTFVAILK